ncbi:hypothetical protein GA0115254_10066 [Streptomyces sp. Ncost-T10-10d]|nr:hypothetical protein GA0115254_10066 [Streptomyces sp. Ncost-T10-10d]
MPGDAPLPGGDARQQFRDQVVHGLQIDHVIVARRAEEPGAAFDRAGSRATAVARGAQAVGHRPGEVAAQPVRIGVADQVGTHLQRVGHPCEAAQTRRGEILRLSDHRDHVSPPRDGGIAPTHQPLHWIYASAEARGRTNRSTAGVVGRSESMPSSRRRTSA